MRTIVWDVDDVLNDLMQIWFNEAWLPAHRQCRLSYEDIRENPPHRILGVDKSEYLKSLDEFRRSKKAHAMDPNPAILKWLRCCGSRFRHVALTARPLDSVPSAAEWLFRHFGAYFRCFGFVPSRPALGMPIYDRDKSDFLQWLGDADFLVDDSEENIARAKDMGIGAILYPRPWNHARGTAASALRLLTEQAEAN